jgi:very-short-patch-repair endonuclease
MTVQMVDDYHPVRGQRVAREKLQRSRELRKEMTNAERMLWSQLRGGQVLGLRFRRQQVIAGFITDFYCHASRFVIEVDGHVHASQKDYDAERDVTLSSAGVHIMRFTNDDVLIHLTDVLARITALCDQARPHPPAPSPIGEGEPE